MQNPTEAGVNSTVKSAYASITTAFCIPALKEKIDQDNLKIQVMATTGDTIQKEDIVHLPQPVRLLVGTAGRLPAYSWRWISQRFCI